MNDQPATVATVCATRSAWSGSDRNDWLIDGLALLLTACLDTGNKLHNSSCVKRFSFVSPPLDLGKGIFNSIFYSFLLPAVAYKKSFSKILSDYCCCFLSTCPSCWRLVVECLMNFFPLHLGPPSRWPLLLLPQPAAC
jgi:hypothetical protein